MAEQDPITDSNSPKTARSRQSRPWKRRILDWSSGLYLVVLLGLVILFNTVGERHWILSILIYVPPQVWLLPGFMFAAIYLFVSRRTWFLYCVVFGFFLLFHMDFHYSFSSQGEGKRLKILTNNIGSRKVQPLSNFIRQEDPDVMLFQEAWRKDKAWSQTYPERYVANLGQFLIVSKFEIKNSGVLTNLWDLRSGPVAVWYELNYHGKPLVVYNVRLPTPRPAFDKLRGKGFLFELARGGGLRSEKVRTEYKVLVKNRLDLAKALHAYLKEETRPFIVAGDFNAPSQSYVSRLFAKDLTDAFAAEGRGYGYTFPSTTMNPLTFFGPWLRLDYIFADKSWRPLDCRVEERQPGQHRAVSAHFELKKE